MRRILVEQPVATESKARRRPDCEEAIPDPALRRCSRSPWKSLTLKEALERLAEKSPRKADLVKLRYFLGCTIEAAQIAGHYAGDGGRGWNYAQGLATVAIPGQADESGFFVKKVPWDLPRRFRTY